jgi:hypothetical protein
MKKEIKKILDKYADMQYMVSEENAVDTFTIDQAVSQILKLLESVVPEESGKCDCPVEQYTNSGDSEWSRCGGCLLCIKDQIIAEMKRRLK